MIKKIISSFVFVQLFLLGKALLIPSACQKFEKRWLDKKTTLLNVQHKNSNSAECVKTIDILSLESIRSTLIRQEETIIFALIERAQYRNNEIVYKKGGLGNFESLAGSRKPVADSDNDQSFLDFMLSETEMLHSYARRYTSPEEHAFFPERLPKDKLALPKLDYPVELLSSKGGASEVNFNEILYKKYVEMIVPSISDCGDDEQYGSTVLADIAVLQAMSRRVHYGKFVAESKYRVYPKRYQKLVDTDDADGVMELLTNSKVEKNVLKRAKIKAATYGTEPLLSSMPQIETSDAPSIVATAAASAVVAAMDAMSTVHPDEKIDPQFIEDVYRNIIIPLTKDIEVAYLFRRCGREPPEEYQPDRMSIDCKKKVEWKNIKDRKQLVREI